MNTDTDYRCMFETLFTETSNIREHLPFLAAIGRGKAVVEFGFAHGRSATAFLAGGCIKLTSYDIEPCEEARSRLSGPRFKFIQQDSLEVTINPTDILFIDDLHTPDHLHAELTRHHENVHDLILMHDTFCWKYPQLRSAILGFMIEHPEWRILFEFRNNNGLTVITRK